MDSGPLSDSPREVLQKGMCWTEPKANWMVSDGLSAMRDNLGYHFATILVNGEREPYNFGTVGNLFGLWTK